MSGPGNFSLSGRALRQAFWAPWRRISRLIGEQLHKLATGKDQAVDKKAGAGIA